MARGFYSTLGAGTTDRVDTTYTSHPTLISYALWTNRNGAGGNSLGRVFEKKNQAGGDRVLLFHTSPNYNFRYAWATSAGNWTWTLPSTSTWVHYVITYDLGLVTNDPIVYENGSSISITEASAPVGVSPSTNVDPYTIGNNGFGDRGFDGQIAEFAMWDRILSAEEAAALGKGYTPEWFPRGMVEYVPLLRANISLKNAAPSITGTAVQPHPRVITPRRVWPGMDITGAVSTVRARHLTLLGVGA